jgi:ComF family protein
MSLRRLGPIRCGRCGAPTLIEVARCRECAGRRLAFVQARAAIVYDERARLIVQAWKERGVRRLGPLGAQLILEALPRPRVDALVALPPDRDRELRRGRHPAVQLAELLARAWELPLESSLARVGTLPRQRGLTVTERRRNVRDAFASVGKAPRAVALIDDVYTTGATVDAAARTLRRSGAARIEVITLARVSRTNVALVAASTT